MKLPFKFRLLKRKKRDDGTIPIYVRFGIDGKYRYRSTGIFVDPKNYEEDDRWGKVKNGCDMQAVYEDQLSEYYYKLLENYKRLRYKEEILSFEDLTAPMDDGNRYDLLEYAEVYRSRLKEDERYWEHRHFGVIINNLTDFLGPKNVNIGKVDAGFLADFQRWLLNEAGPQKKKEKRGNSPNTVRRKMQRFRAMFNKAKQANDIRENPFETFDELVKKEPVEKVKLSPSQIKDIEKLDLEKGSPLWHTRNYFMYSFYNAGIRFGDLCCLTWSNIVDGRLEYTMNKTGGLKSIKQLDSMWEILDKYKTGDQSPDDYIFPLLERKIKDPMELRRVISSRNVTINGYLDDIAEAAGITKNVSFHIARHSFAQYALEKGIDLYSISKALGHADLKTTEQYLKSFDEQKLDESMETLFN